MRSIRLSRRGCLPAALLTIIFCSLGLPARAIIFYSTADPNHNTQAPSGALAGSGWQWVGNLGGFHGVPIGPHHFVTAAHVGSVSPGTLFVLNGVNYTTVQFYRDSASDLLIWQVSESFPNWAPLYRSADELGRPFVVFGSGAVRGDPVLNIYGTLGGWKDAPGDGRLRWGTNQVSSIDQTDGLLIAEFNSKGGGEEACLGDGDSSGAVFIRDPADGVWKLAGINYGVEAYFNNTEPPTGNGFIAALFDKGGFYLGNSSGWQWIPDTQADKPSLFAATRVSNRAAWIDSVAPPQPDAQAADAPIFSPAGAAFCSILLMVLGVLALRQKRAARGFH